MPHSVAQTGESQRYQLATTVGRPLSVQTNTSPMTVPTVGLVKCRIGCGCKASPALADSTLNSQRAVYSFAAALRETRSSSSLAFVASPGFCARGPDARGP